MELKPSDVRRPDYGLLTQFGGSLPQYAIDGSDRSIQDRIEANIAEFRSSVHVCRQVRKESASELSLD